MRGTLLRFKTKRLLVAALSTLLLLAVFLLSSRAYSAAQASSLIYTLDTVPSRPVAIVFGAWVAPDGSPSAMLADRVAMAAELYHAGKVQFLLLTGDNHIETYNEPEAMRQYALSLGIPDSALVLDYAGFRTYDSCYRAQAIFQVHEAILVTQAFHLDRALLTCNHLGVASVAVAADVLRENGYGQYATLSEIREFPSTALVFLDFLVARKPCFLGETLPIIPEA